MDITVNKIKKELQKQYGWENLDCEDKKWFVDGLIKDTLAIVDEQLRIHKDDTLLSKKSLLNYGFSSLGTAYMRRNEYSKGTRELILWFDNKSKIYSLKVSNAWYEIKTIGQLKQLYYSLVGSELQLLEAGI
jgi:hypothetical protein